MKMNFKTAYALVSILLLITTVFFSCMGKDDVMIRAAYKVQSDGGVTKDDFNLLKNSIQKRLSEYGMELKEWQEDVAQKEINISAIVERKDEQIFKSLFSSSELDLWNTYKISDDVIANIDSNLLRVENFVPYMDLELGYQPVEVLGICKDVNKLLEIQSVLEDNLKAITSLRLVWSFNKEGVDQADYRLYMINTKGSATPLLTEQYITNAVASDNSYQDGGYVINFKFNEEGTKIWAKATEQAAMDGNRSIAIVLNNRLYLCPRVMSPIYSGNGSITGNFTLQEAEKLAKILEAGRLLFPLELLEVKLMELE